jgi:glycosyltransferase involved in cell wall biosynthesis
MSIMIADLELTRPLPRLLPLNGATGILALVRSHGRPIGLVRLTAHGSSFTAAQLEAAIAAQIAQPEDVPVTTPQPSEPISIVVCTHERPEDLRQCLSALLPMLDMGHEVIVVDSAPDTPCAAELAAEYPFRYLREPRPGLNIARNTGWRAASYSVVAFTDDDAISDPAWADMIDRAIQPVDVGCVTGLVLPRQLDTNAQEQFELYCAHRRAFRREVFAAPRLRPAAAGVVGMGANMAFRRDLLKHLGGFDPRLDGGTPTCSGGDTDMFARVLESGWHIAYEPAALVWHRHRRTDQQLQDCLFGYGVGLFSFLTKRLVEARDWRAAVVAGRWFIGPFVKAARRRWQGQPSVPLLLLLLEALGACVGPWRFWQATRQDRMGRPIRSQPVSAGFVGK